jgi:hypothetical protein
MVASRPQINQPRTPRLGCTKPRRTAAKRGSSGPSISRWIQSHSPWSRVGVQPKSGGSFHSSWVSHR